MGPPPFFRNKGTLNAMRNVKLAGILQAIAAAVFYALNMPLSKLLLRNVAPTMMAALLYLGAGVGIGILFLLKRGDRRRERLSKRDRHARKFCVSEIRQIQGWRFGNRADCRRKPFHTQRRGGSGGMRAEGVNAARPARTA